MASYQFEWDVEKAETNQQKHGVTFDEAITAFSDPLAMLLPDPRDLRTAGHSEGAETV